MQKIVAVFMVFVLILAICPDKKAVCAHEPEKLCRVKLFLRHNINIMGNFCQAQSVLLATRTDIVSPVKTNTIHHH